MGHHYIPRAYLRHFASTTDPDRVWMYDKKTGKTYHSLIKEVAQKPSFYRTDVESSLNVDVELPGTAVIKKLLQGHLISDEDREELGRYIATTIKRVPYHRAFVNSTLYPELLARTTEKYRDRLRALRGRADIPAGLIDQKLAETDVAEQKLLENMPSKVREIIADPRPQTATPDVVSANLASFHWQILKCAGPSFFLTTDNPVHRHGEIVFPLSSTHCLRGDPARPGKSLTFSKIDEKHVCGINKLLAGNSDRYAYYGEQVPWIHKLLKRTA
jgi:hypothetical protein